MRRLRRFLSIAVAHGLLAGVSAPADDAAGRAESAASHRPNILFITADNLGYGDLSCYRPSSLIKAPQLSRLAREGARLTSFYTASPTCTVSRAGLLTGRIAQRHGLENQLPGIEGNYGPGLDTTEILIPQILGEAGYATGCFGKWNIGFAPGSRPTERGFDEFFGHASGNIDYYSHIYGGRHDLYRGTEEAHVEGYSTDLFADAAIEFMLRPRKRPWFVYLPFNAPHFPSAKNKQPGQPVRWQAPEWAFEEYGYDPQTDDPQQGYRAVVTALDAAIGRVLEALNEFGQAQNTFVVFYSDNGAFMLADRGLEVSTNAPLRDGGVTCWEGGLRVAALVRWPGQIEAGSVVDEPLWAPDLLIAAAKLAETRLPRDRTLDRRDPLPVLISGAKSPHRSFYFSFRSHAALRMENWKIVRTRPEQQWQLFNLADDLGESEDLSARHAERLRSLVEEFGRWEESFDTDEPPAGR